MDRTTAQDRQDFADWVQPHLAAMARLAARLAPLADRDDIVQEALTRAWLKRHQFDPSRGTASAWLLAVTADQARKAARRRRPWPRPLLGDPPISTLPDDRVDLQRALRRLSTRQRLAVECFYFADLSISDTAAVMRCSEGTVKSTLVDARTRLRALLEVTS